MRVNEERIEEMKALADRDTRDAEEAERRITSQMSLDEKRDRATWVIDNSGSLDETEAQVDDLWSELMGRTTRASAHG